MSMLRNVFGGCVSDKSTENVKNQKLKFGVPLSVALKHGYLPHPFVELLVYIAKEGVATTDLFRRPGNPNDTRRIVKRLQEGKPVVFANYNFYTLASVVKKFILKLPGGIFTPEGEEYLLEVLTMTRRFEQCQRVNEFINSLSVGHQQLVSLLFGTWFRIVNHSDVNSMSVEALARSVAGSMFLTCADDPEKVERAIRIMQLLIDNFGVASMFGRENIEYFTKTTLTGIHVREKFRYEYNYPSEEILPPITEEEFYGSPHPHVHYQSDENVGERRLARSEGGNGRSESVGPNWPASNRESRSCDESQLVANDTTASAPEVSTIPSPDFSKRPKSLEDNLNDIRVDYKTRCLSRYNSVKRRQMERLRQRSDWFLGPPSGSTNGRAGGGPGSRGSGNNRNHKNNTGNNNEGSSSCRGGGGGGDGDVRGGGIRGETLPHLQEHQSLKAKTSGTSVTKSSSEGAVLDVIGSDADSVFTDTTSRSESPASEPIRSLATREQRSVIHSDNLVDITAVPDNMLKTLNSRRHTTTDGNPDEEKIIISTMSGRHLHPVPEEPEEFYE